MLILEVLRICLPCILAVRCCEYLASTCGLARVCCYMVCGCCLIEQSSLLYYRCRAPLFYYLPFGSDSDIVDWVLSAIVPTGMGLLLGFLFAFPEGVVVGLFKYKDVCLAPSHLIVTAYCLYMLWVQACVSSEDVRLLGCSLLLERSDVRQK